MKRYSPPPVPAQHWDGIIPGPNPSAPFSGGSGLLKSDPYIIGSAADLAQLSANVANNIIYENRFFELACDIYLNNCAINECDVNPAKPGAAGYNDGNINHWQPIGGAGFGLDPYPGADSESYAFAGHFDGCCHTIHNAFYNRQEGGVIDRACRPQNLVGIFGSIWAVGSLKNLNTEGGYIGAHISVGGIVGRTWGTIENCHNGNFVYSTGPHGAAGVVGAGYVQYISSPVGTIEARASIDGCSNCATIVNNYISENSGKKSGSAGGIVGENEGNIINSWNTGNISCLLNAGGVIGSNQDQSSDGYVTIDPPGYINNCYNWGKVGSYTGCGKIPSTEAIYAGGIVAWQTGSAQNVYNIGEVTANGVDNASPARPSAAGQIIGEMKAGIGSSEVNDWFFYKDGGTSTIPVGLPTSGWDFGIVESFNSDGELPGMDDELLLDTLNLWVDEFADDGNSYDNWISVKWPKFASRCSILKKLRRRK